MFRLCALWGTVTMVCVLTFALRQYAALSHPVSRSLHASTVHAAAIPVPLTAAQLARIKPNEVGVVPILEYHDIGPKDKLMCRSIAGFRRDLQRLYALGYRPVALQDYLANRIALPPGKSPVIFTFDDARDSQFCYRPDGTIDPNCVVGILQGFARQHPDFPIRATFYVLPPTAFGQPKLRAKKLRALIAMRCEIGNHTVHHKSLQRLSDAQVRQEVAGCVAMVHKLVPQAKVESLALPFGRAPRHRALLASGWAGGQHYINRAVLLAGAEPAPSPVSRRFDPMRLPRVQPVAGGDGLDYWLDILKHHPERRYISDGDPNTITVPRARRADVDRARLHKARLRIY